MSDFFRMKADDVADYADLLTRYISDIKKLRKYYCKSWSRNQMYDLKGALSHLAEARRYFSTLKNSCSCDANTVSRRQAKLREEIQMRHHIDRMSFLTDDEIPF